jgi:hypothetical protein
MYDPNPDAKDPFVSKFEHIMKDENLSDEDKKLREQIKQTLLDLPTSVSSDK